TRLERVAMIDPIEAGVARLDERLVRQDGRPHNSWRRVMPVLDGDRARSRELRGAARNAIEIVVLLRLDFVLLVNLIVDLPDNALGRRARRKGGIGARLRVRVLLVLKRSEEPELVSFHRPAHLPCYVLEFVAVIRLAAV